MEGFPCSQAHNLLTCDQPDPKDNFSTIKKYEKIRHFDQNFRDGPLKDIELGRLIAIWASVFALEITHGQLIVWCTYATAVFGTEGKRFTSMLKLFHILRLLKKLIHYLLVTNII